MSDEFNIPDTFGKIEIGTPPTVPTLTIHSPNTSMMVTIGCDGTVTYGPDYTPDAAAKIFWEAMGDAAPMARIARLEAALKRAHGLFADMGHDEGLDAMEYALEGKYD